MTGIVPPLSAADWQADFDRYKQIPQFAELNPDMTLDGFKTIFWWEWSHRLLARIVGAAFILPALWFWVRGALKGALGRQVAVATALLALEPIVGWWMVTSGLSERTEVAQDRLALHLMIAAATFGALIYAAVGFSERPRAAAPGGYAISAAAFAALVYFQLGLGALVAGLRAGLDLQHLAADGLGLPAQRGVRIAPRDARRSGDRAIRSPADRLRCRRLRDRPGHRGAASAPRRRWRAGPRSWRASRPCKPGSAWRRCCSSCRSPSPSPIRRSRSFFSAWRSGTGARR